MDNWAKRVRGAVRRRMNAGAPRDGLGIAGDAPARSDERALADHMVDSATDRMQVVAC